MPVMPWVSGENWLLYQGHVLDVLRAMSSDSVHCVVTSPPYLSLRDYGLQPVEWPEVEYAPMAALDAIRIPAWEGCLGMERDPRAYVGHLVAVFRELRRVLRPDGSVWLNIGDSYARAGGTDKRPPQKAKVGATRNTLRYIGNRTSRPPEGLKDKDLMGVPWRVALALQADGWWLRSEVIWAKQAPAPESVRDRPTRSHEQILLLSRGPKYYYNLAAIKDHDGANVRDVWSFRPASSHGEHIAVFPEELPKRCIAVGCPEGGVVLDPFAGSGTTLLAAAELGRRAVGIEVSERYCSLIEERMASSWTRVAVGGDAP